ncbi:MAG: ribosome biogenesis GTP-binding protein YihA/YsxC [Acidimicrobiales bacterium]
MSATALGELPPTPAEVAVAGRSNVGKSSLINALAGRRNLANTSNTPGRTQLLNLFAVDRPGVAPPAGDEGSTCGSPTVVDLPGYGYSAVPKHVRSGWEAMIEGYLLGRRELEKVMVLVDGEIGPTKLDVQMLDWLRASGLPHAVVATKADKVKPSRRERRRDDLAAGCEVDAGEVAWVSAAKGTGVDELRSVVRGWLDA